jgi:hypothetical protein
MKYLFQIFMILLFIFSSTSVCQDLIKDFDGIPIEAGLHWDWVRLNPVAIDSMKKAGVDIVRMDIARTSQMDTLRTIFNLNALPIKSLDYNYIRYYTDAKYSVWEAEGTPPSKGDATLEFKSNVGEVVISGGVTYLRLKSEAAGSMDTLIYGPYYRQDVKYYTSLDDIFRTVQYTANYRMKLELNQGYQDNINPNTPLCKIQVTQSYAVTTQQLGCTYVIKERTIKRSDFAQLNQFYDFRLDPTNAFDYTLESDSCTAPPPSQPPDQYTFQSDLRIASGLREAEESVGPRVDRKYIQFKIIWLGIPNYLLSVDKVTISDERGVELMDPLSSAEANILAQANSLPNHTDLLAGWLGVDEPTSIDIFEPIRKVTEILDNYSTQQRPLWLAFMGRWDGAFDNRDNTFGAMSLSPWEEFDKRVGRANIIQDLYIYDYPCKESSEYSICNGDWRATNIERAARLNYEQAYRLDPYWGVSLQCGEVHTQDLQADERNIAAHELLYNANLALMCGAKFLSLYTYFAQSDTLNCLSGLTCHAIVDWTGGITNEIYTDKYNMLRYKLNPRLKGWFGQTLKNITKDTLILAADFYTRYNFIEKISYNECDYELRFTEPVFDLGFFTKDSKDYFMITSRYYNEVICPLDIKINYLTNSFNNFRVTNFIDSTITNM